MYRSNIDRDETREREVIKQDLVSAASTWPLSQLQELVSFAGIPTFLLTRDLIKQTFFNAAEYMPLENLQEFHAVARIMAYGGVSNWGLPSQTGDNPFELLQNYLDTFRYLGISDYDELDAYLSSN